VHRECAHAVRTNQANVLATGTDRQGCKRFFKQGDWKLVLLLGAGAGDEHFKHLQ